eukprot:Transcript_16504.p1 GENE.Transcript_16504~~Transcript_16504.p1  ORF type:complete len:345 (-),score=94.10 Transcript_16504:210-1187(-)
MLFGLASSYSAFVPQSSRPAVMAGAAGSAESSFRPLAAAVAPLTRSCRTASPRLGLLPENSLGAKMFGTVADGLKGLADGAKDLAEKAGIEMGDEDEAADTPAAPESGPPKNTALENAVKDIDGRAAAGEVTFRDFLTMSRTISGMDDSMSALPPGLSASQLLELREKVVKHEKIVEVMMDEEKAGRRPCSASANATPSPSPGSRASLPSPPRPLPMRSPLPSLFTTTPARHQDDPELLLEDLKSGGSTPGPRMQRIATASGETEAEVGLFLMQFEAMRESTRRIAAGEDPDEVNESLSAPPGANRQARRIAQKKKAKAAKKVKK